MSEEEAKKVEVTKIAASGGGWFVVAADGAAVCVERALEDDDESQIVDMGGSGGQTAVWDVYLMRQLRITTSGYRTSIAEQVRVKNAVLTAVAKHLEGLAAALRFVAPTEDED